MSIAPAIATRYGYAVTTPITCIDMRSGSAAYADLGAHCAVVFDGLLRTECLMADEERGIIVVYDKNDNEIILHGTVELEYSQAPQ